MKSWHLHIEGQVQGVGFRPYVYQMARRYGLAGWVNNTSDGVHVAFLAEAEEARAFTAALIRQAPGLSRITSHRLRQTEPQTFTDFRIIHSESDGPVRLLITPDFAMCEDCRSELRDPGDRRYGYPFITCTNCGPRYSITHRLPYDRITTTMAPFRMCPVCQGEYDDPDDRRYYSQTNSCPDCSIKLSLSDQEGKVLSSDTAHLLRYIPQLWEAGHIVAIKGIGGYLLTCDARRADTIQLLRRRKQRPSKPFALMYPDLERVRRHTHLTDEAEAELLSYRAPIVLLPLRDRPAPDIAAEAIAPGLSRIGVMLPYTPLFDELLQTFGHPIVATSGNLSNAPIVFQDDKAQEELLRIADFLLSNDRDIVIPQDDSVIQFSPFQRQRIILRRSRGMAPSFADRNLPPDQSCILATGALLKSTFALYHQGNTFISQYLGDLQDFDTEQNYRHTLRHFFELFATQPRLILTDKHPEYASTRYGQELAEDLQVPVADIQHHLAHFGAILGEHQLLDSTNPILGVIWDGTGLGDDGHIWGGEFFRYQDHAFHRCGQFSYFDFLLGDKMPREPRISALAIAGALPGVEELLRPKFKPREWALYQQLLSAGTPLKSSSVGRIFDAAASLLGLADRQSYEGEAALLLEELAREHCRAHGLNIESHYLPTGDHEGVLPTGELFRAMIAELRQGGDRAAIAAKFHYSLVQGIRRIAQRSDCRRLAFSGGVFQNGLLIDLLIHHLGADFELLFHRDLSPNDENIAYGQLMAYHIRQRRGAED